MQEGRYDIFIYLLQFVLSAVSKIGIIIGSLHSGGMVLCSQIKRLIIELQESMLLPLIELPQFLIKIF